ncbi:MAG: radical SAM protein [bacterium]|nr:radical SAM protein [bacterium]
MKKRIVFGPVPSRRLGQSLGINNIPPKICSYSCVYCQIGKTTDLSMGRSPFYTIERIVEEVDRVIKQLRKKKEKIDYISFVSDGEPTLDIHLGKEIEALKKFKIPIAVLTNSTLLWREDVRDDLKKADLVSLKIDTVDKYIWKQINKPVEGILLENILEGVKNFSQKFTGILITETVLVKDINDMPEEIRKTAEFISAIKPKKAYIGIPTRPPAEVWVKQPEEKKVLYAYEIFTEYGLNAELITETGPGSFGFTGDIESDIVSTISVHPMSEQQIRELLKKASSDWTVVEKLLSENKIREIEYQGEKYYIKSFK